MQQAPESYTYKINQWPSQGYMHGPGRAYRAQPPALKDRYTLIEQSNILLKHSCSKLGVAWFLLLGPLILCLYN